MKSFFVYCIRKVRSLRRDDDGFVVMLTLSLFLLLYVLCSSVYAVADTIQQKIRLQNACDAAAYSAAVVQADGLSRMATVNQALEWSYVQMSNHQMDCITYRWLYKTRKLFREDKHNASEFHSYLVINFNINEGIPGLIVAAIELGANRLMGIVHPSWELRCNRQHHKEGPGWWAGQGPGYPGSPITSTREDGRDRIKLNGHPFEETVHINVINESLNNLDGAFSSFSGSGSGSSGDSGSGSGSGNGGGSGSGDSGSGSGGNSGGGNSGGGSGSGGSGGNSGGGNSGGDYSSGDSASNPEPEFPELKALLGKKSSDPDEDDPYGVYAYVDNEREDEDDDEGLTEAETIGRLDQWRADSQAKIDAKIEEDYQSRIDQETDPDLKKELEKERDEKRQELYSDLDEVYAYYEQEIHFQFDSESKIPPPPDVQKILDDYSAMKDDAATPASYDPDAYGQWYQNQQSLEAESIEKIDEYYSSQASAGTADSQMASPPPASLAPQLNSTSSLSSSHLRDYAVNGSSSWETTMLDMIEADRTTIQLLNEVLPAINYSMQSSMQTVAEFVLVNMMRDPRLTDEQVLKKYQVYISIPQALDPYSAGTGEQDEQSTVYSTAGGFASNFFSPLYNTEPNERLFLQFGSEDKHAAERDLYEFFPVADQDATNEAKEDPKKLAGWGLDQWYIRTGSEIPEGYRYRPRTEGELGIQRGYKDANMNETNAGFLTKKVDRGNHIANLFLGEAGIAGMSEDGEYKVPENSGSSLGGGFMNLLESFFQSLFSSLLKTLSDLCDVGASSGNARIDGQFRPMCSHVGENTALCAEYDWASAKWICLAKPKKSSLFAEYLLCGHFHEVLCDPRSSTIDRKCRRHRLFFKRHRGLGHYHIPKWFCGEYPRWAGDVGHIKKDMSSWAYRAIFLALLDTIPPSVEPIENGHGYLTKDNKDEKVGPLKLFEWAMYEPFRQMRERFVSREEFRNCVCFIDGLFVYLTRQGFMTGGNAGLINGHTRIYGDDEDLYNTPGPDAKSRAPEIYVGEKVKPWILNEKFFSGAGTIVIGAAVKHENPFMLMVSKLQSNDDEGMDERNVLSAFDPPFYRGISYNGKRISGGNYMWTMSAARAAVRRTRRNGLFDMERMYQVVYDHTSDPENLHFASTPYRYMANQDSGRPGEWQPYTDGNSVYDPQKACVLGGCVCTQENKEQFEAIWNLCEQDWDATLLPLRYAGSGASLNGFSVNANYRERLSQIDALRRNGSFKNNCGNGRNWTWTPDPNGNTSAGNANPLNPANPSEPGWSSPDPDSNPEKIRLDSLLPDGKHKVDLLRLLKQNRIL